MLLEQPNPVLVNRRASDADAWGRAKPVQDTRPCLRTAPGRVDDVGVLVAPFIAGEAKERQSYFLF
jgi:hypothetical protein